MPFVNIVALLVTDQRMYAEYRRNMTPLLTACGGMFQFDVEVSRDLKQPERKFNRLFAVQFPDRETRNHFFVDPQYLAIRAKYFNPAVASVHELGDFEGPLS